MIDTALELLINAQKYLSTQKDDVLIRELRDRGYVVNKAGGDLNMKQVAMLTGFTVGALRKKYYAGTMPQGYKLGNRTLRFPVQEIQDWMEQKRKQSRETFASVKGLKRTIDE